MTFTLYESINTAFFNPELYHPQSVFTTLNSLVEQAFPDSNIRIGKTDQGSIFAAVPVVRNVSEWKVQNHFQGSLGTIYDIDFTEFLRRTCITPCCENSYVQAIKPEVYQFVRFGEEWASKRGASWMVYGILRAPQKIVLSNLHLGLHQKSFLDGYDLDT